MCLTHPAFSCGAYHNAAARAATAAANQQSLRRLLQRLDIPNEA